MALTENEKLRQLLGEPVEEDETEADTLFSDEEIEDFLTRADGNLDRAAFDGWRAKAAKLSNLVDTSEGNSQKKFSQLVDNANDMIKLYQRSTTGNTEGRARVGRIKRAAVPWE